MFLALGGLLLLKHWLFGEYGPFDRCVELAVLAAILYEIVAEAIRRRAEAKHQRFVDQRAIALTQRLTKGERLHQTVPNTTSTNAQAADSLNAPWIEQVNKWITDTNMLLSSSRKASAEFMALADAGPVNEYVGNPPHGFYLRKDAAQWYYNLAIHLENLRRIINTPRTYF